jgi:large subunit ribosomal protein L20
MHGLKLSNIRLNNKTLSNLALNEPFSFKALVDQVKFMKGMLPGQKAAQQAL